MNILGWIILVLGVGVGLIVIGLGQLFSAVREMTLNTRRMAAQDAAQQASGTSYEGLWFISGIVQVVGAFIMGAAVIIGVFVLKGGGQTTLY